jgi:hypothetical protein
MDAATRDTTGQGRDFPVVFGANALVPNSV